MLALRRPADEMSARLISSPPRDPQPVRHGRALIILAIIILLILAACDATTPGPDVGCYPNHSGVCEGPPLTPAEMDEVNDIRRELLRRDTTNGRDVQL